MQTELQLRADVEVHPDDLDAPLLATAQHRPAEKPRSEGTPAVALFGNFGSDNFGNEGSLRAMVGFLRRERPEARLFCVCADPVVVQGALGMPAVAIRRPGGSARRPRVLKASLKVLDKVRDLARAFREIRQADVMIVPGTGILDDFGEPPQGMPLDIFIWCLAARMSGTKVAFVSAGAGPIGHPVSRWLMVSAARMAHYRSWRDTISRDFMRNAGLNVADDAVYPDIAFKLPTPVQPARATSGTGILTVGVGVMKYRGWYFFADGGQAIFDSYLDRLARFVLHLLEAGHHVKLLTGEITDMEAVDALIARLQSVAGGRLPEHASAARSSSLHCLMEEISSTDVVVATRFHNIVCALMMEKPVISLGYSEKNDVLLAEMGLGEFCQRVEAFDVDVLIAHFERAVARRRELEDAIRARNLEFRKRLDLQDGRLLSEVLSSRC
ncbi:polysaccharide pyruvyl transferase family protein [Sinorhizobium fredii]